MVLELWLLEALSPPWLLERNNQNLVLVGLESGSLYRHYDPAAALDSLRLMLDRSWLHLEHRVSALAVSPIALVILTSLQLWMRRSPACMDAARPL